MYCQAGLIASAFIAHCIISETGTGLTEYSFKLIISLAAVD
jgi:hypothetical protein